MSCLRQGVLHKSGEIEEKEGYNSIILTPIRTLPVALFQSEGSSVLMVSWMMAHTTCLVGIQFVVMMIRKTFEVKALDVIGHCHEGVMSSIQKVLLDPRSDHTLGYKPNTVLEPSSSHSLLSTTTKPLNQLSTIFPTCLPPTTTNIVWLGAWPLPAPLWSVHFAIIGVMGHTPLQRRCVGPSW